MQFTHHYKRLLLKQWIYRKGQNKKEKYTAMMENNKIFIKPYRLRRKKDIIFPERKWARTPSKPLQ